ncbi:LAME_0A00804g1_1 [Lachancea meyersii CBS 8951]|uniref:LAME_0A00804g1_1 n=1 Tax=Lachancea meyersii CBS 8951 TaxID=1266667 RepID=A0A1G4ILB4_9SACH|nr:LAME_0A00804g1_1 [Lachancea meyersii CBS 8951]
MVLANQNSTLLKKFPDSERGEETFAEDSLTYGSVSSLRSDDLEFLSLDLGFHNEVPQGRHLGVFSTVVLFVSRIIGSGIFAAPSSIFVGCGGNPILFFGIWFFAAAMAFAGLYLFLEFGSLLPRSGGRKNFLEAVYTKPAKMMSVTFTTYTVLMGMAVSNAIVFGKYVLYGLGFDEDFVNKNSAACNYVGAVLVICISFIHGYSVKGGILVQNFLGALKLLFALIISLTGIYAVCFYKPAEYSSQIATTQLPSLLQSQDVVTVSSVTTAFIQAFFCFAGWDTVHTVASEIKNPVRTLKIAGPLSLGACLLCYLSVNVAYLKVFTYEEFKAAGPLAGSILFTRLLGENVGRKLITLGIALSAASNLFVVVYSTSRMSQECFREGFLPFSKIMASNRPWGAPLSSSLLCAALTCFWLILLPSSGAAYSYLVALEGYSNQLIILLVAVGLFIYRKRNPDVIAEIRANSLGVGALIVLSTYLLIGPFIGDQHEATVSHLPPYPVAALLIMTTCLGFWFMKFIVFPKLLGYELKRKVHMMEDSLVSVEWYKEYAF